MSQGAKHKRALRVWVIERGERLCAERIEIKYQEPSPKSRGRWETFFLFCIALGPAEKITWITGSKAWINHALKYIPLKYNHRFNSTRAITQPCSLKKSLLICKKGLIWPNLIMLSSKNFNKNFPSYKVFFFFFSQNKNEYFSNYISLIHLTKLQKPSYVKGFDNILFICSNHYNYIYI